MLVGVGWWRLGGVSELKQVQSLIKGCSHYVVTCKSLLWDTGGHGSDSTGLYRVHQFSKVRVQMI